MSINQKKEITSNSAHSDGVKERTFKHKPRIVGEKH